MGGGSKGGKKGTTLYLNCFYPSPDLTVHKQFVLKGGGMRDLSRFFVRIGHVTTYCTLQMFAEIYRDSAGVFSAISAESL